MPVKSSNIHRLAEAVEFDNLLDKTSIDKTGTELLSLLSAMPFATLEVRLSETDTRLVTGIEAHRTVDGESSIILHVNKTAQ